MEKKQYNARSKSVDHSVTINGILTRRAVIFKEAIGLHKRLREIQKDVAAIDRILEVFDYDGDADGLMPRRLHETIFRRGELVRLVFKELRRAEKPLTTRQLACLIIVARGEDEKDKKYVTKITKRVYKKLMLLKKDGDVRLMPGNRGKHQWELTLIQRPLPISLPRPADRRQ